MTAVPFQKHSEVGRRAIGLSCSLTQFILLFLAQARLVAAGGRVKRVTSWATSLLQCPCSGCGAAASLGKCVAIATCCAGSQGAQPRFLSFPQVFTLKVRPYDPQVSALSKLVLGRQSKLFPPDLREGIFQSVERKQIIWAVPAVTLGRDEPYLRSACIFFS